jgi:peroxiredoxin
MKRSIVAVCWLGAFGDLACTRPGVVRGAEAPPVTALDAKGTEVDIRAAAHDANVTVVEFFSAHCPCQRAHDERLNGLYDEYATKGVRVIAVDSEAGASPARANSESSARGYRFPLLADPTGAAARELGATAATYTVVLDRDGRVRYAGGIDSDRVHLTADAKHYVRDAVDDLLAGRSPRVTEGRTLGCALER